MAEPITGGCQCGAVRYRCEGFGRASICHCRMCQKAFGAFYGPLVTGKGLVWTRGEPSWFQSSNKVRRGFCACQAKIGFASRASPVDHHHAGMALPARDRRRRECQRDQRIELTGGHVGQA